MSDVAYAMTNDHEDYELINGQVYMMSRPNTNHMKIELNIATIFNNYLNGKRCVPFNETDVFFDDDNNFVPDVIIVCDPEIIEDDGIHGTPDLVVEILSKSTARKDRAEKFFAYEKYGVKEYWIVEPVNKSVDVFLLKEGRFIPSGTYQLLTDEQFNKLSEKAKSNISTEIKVSLYDDFIVNIKDIFKRVK